MLLNQQDSLVLLIDVQDKLTPLVLDSKQLIARCQWMMQLAKRMQVPILVSEQYPKGLGTTLEQFHPYYVQGEAIDKVSFSCMQDEKYRERLTHYHKKQIILIGIETHVCVLQTALDLLAAGYEVFVVVDAVSSRHDLDMKYGLKRMKQDGAHLVTSEMVFFEWIRKAGTEEFKALSKEFLQAGSK